MPQSIKVQSPLKGVNRAFSREQQPADTVWDALNMMPSDRYGRLRVAQRSGIGLLDSLAAAAPVRLLHIASTVSDPSITAGGDTAILTEPFTYANGDLGGQATWNTFDGSDVPVSDGIAVLSNQAVTGAGNHPQSYALGQTAITLGNDWDMNIDVVFGATTGGGNTYQFGMFANFDNAVGEPQIDYVSFSMLRDGGASVGLLSVDGGVDVQFNLTATPSATHTFTLRKRGTAFTALIDGVQVLAATGNATMAFDGAGSYGFFFDGNDPLNNAVTADNLTITQPGGVGTADLIRTTLKLVAASGTVTYIGTVPTNMVAVANSGSFPLDADAPFLSAATLFGFTYIVDGVGEPKKLDLSDDMFETFTESAGDCPDGASIAAAWRGRLVLAGFAADPQNFVASAAGNPLDWDTGAGEPTSAWAGNAAESGRIGNPVQALIPISDDILIIGCEQSMWAVRGDIADGGSIDCITDFAGISSQTAWTRGPDGAVYFVGPRGFFRLNATATEVTEISQATYPQFFQSINRQTQYINLIYDADRYGIWVFVAPGVEGAAVESMFYDFRFQGFWPQNFENQLNAGPLSAVWWDGYDSDTRYPIIGGYDGELFAFNHTNRTDNGGTIESEITLGPFQPTQGSESLLIGTTINLGELSVADQAVPSRWQSSVSLFAGKTAYDVTQGDPLYTGIVSWGAQGRTKTMRQRLRGEWFSVRISNSAAGNYFSLESVELEFSQGGKNRRQG